MPHSPPELPLEGVEGQQLQRHRVQSRQRQMADALVAVSSLANVLGKCQFVVDTLILLENLVEDNETGWFFLSNIRKVWSR